MGVWVGPAGVEGVPGGSGLFFCVFFEVGVVGGGGGVLLGCERLADFAGWWLGLEGGEVGRGRGWDGLVALSVSGLLRKGASCS